MRSLIAFGLALALLPSRAFAQSEWQSSVREVPNREVDSAELPAAPAPAATVAQQQPPPPAASQVQRIIFAPAHPADAMPPPPPPPDAQPLPPPPPPVPAAAAEPESTGGIRSISANDGLPPPAQPAEGADASAPGAPELGTAQQALSAGAPEAGATPADPAATAAASTPASEGEQCEGPGGSAGSTSPAYGFRGTGDAPGLGEMTKSSKDGVGAGLGMGSIDKDIYATIPLATSFKLGKLGLGVQVPLRFRVFSLEPGRREPGFDLRKEDWDEVSDYLKILRYVEYGDPKDTFYGRFGELSGTSLGHGTIVNGYYNSVDIDKYQAGLRLNVNARPGGVETMLNSISDPRLLGGRAYLRPWYFVDPCSVLNRFAMGVSTFVDTRTPTDASALSADQKGNLHGPARSLALYGVDFEFTVFANALIDLTPYTDFNFVDGGGGGTHAGILFGLHPPAIAAQARLEYRRLDAHYLPAYFDALYEVERFGYRDDRTKLEWLEENGGTPLNGYYGELVVGVLESFSIMGGYEDYDGPNNGRLHLRAVLPAMGPLRLGAYYTKRDFEGFDEIFSKDRALGVIEARYAFNPFLALVVAGTRQWQLDKETELYATTDTFNAGFQLSVPF